MDTTRRNVKNMATIKFESCPKCRIRMMEAWEIMCQTCFKAGKMDDELPTHNWDDFPDEDD
jgi:hypothetical protein